MHRIDPITEENCKPHCGKPVLIYLHDGSEIYGVMSRIENGKLILNDFSSNDLPITQTSKKRKATRGKKSSQKADVNALAGPYPYGGFPFPFEVIALELATIALLFAFLI